MNDYPPITGELRAAMTTALDGETGDEVLYCDNGRFADLCDRIDAVHAALECQCERQRVHGSGLVVHPFIRDDDKAAALKPLEEAAEIYGAWQVFEANDKQTYCGDKPCQECEGHAFCWTYKHPEAVRREKDLLADEIADTITACVNLAHRYGIDLQAAIDRVEVHNRERGRYDG